MARAVGIDLGTTNSVVAVLEGGEPTVIANAEGFRTTPSVVAFTKDGEVLVGETAKRQAVTNVDRTISSVKRHMGTDWTVDIDGKKYTPQEISARILQKLKRDAEQYLGEPVTDAVITVPAYFNDAERQATKEAGEIAGLNVLRIINEPTAAALAYGLDKGKEDELILVFDLGGGTFDVSLLEVGKDEATSRPSRSARPPATTASVATTGTSASSTTCSSSSRTPPASTCRRTRSRCSASRRPPSRPRRSCRARTRTNIQLPYLSLTENGPANLDETLTRAQFERPDRATCSTAPRSRSSDVIKEAGIKVGDIDHVVLVGGSTRMPAVTELVKELTGGKEPNKGVNPDEVVAVGAALQAGVLKGERKDVLLIDVTPLSPRHRDQGRHDDQADRAQHRDPDQAQRDLHDRRRQPAVRRDPGLPGRARVHPRQQAARHVRADRHRAGAARHPADRGHLRHRRERHRARVRQGQGHRQGAVDDDHRRARRCPKEDIERMVREAEEHAAEDKARREDAEARNTAEQLVYSIEKLIKDNEDKLPADVKTEVQADVDALKTRARRRRRRRGEDRVRQAQREPDQARPGDLLAVAGERVDRRRRVGPAGGRVRLLRRRGHRRRRGRRRGERRRPDDRPGGSRTRRAPGQVPGARTATSSSPPRARTWRPSLSDADEAFLDGDGRPAGGRGRGPPAPRTSTSSRPPPGHGGVRQLPPPHRAGAGRGCASAPIGDAARVILPVLDDLDRAEAHGDLAEGGPLTAIAQKLRGAVAKLGITPYGEKGEVFDPHEHDAIFQRESPDVSSGPTVSDVVERGYRIGETALRSAKVVVDTPSWS